MFSSSSIVSTLAAFTVIALTAGCTAQQGGNETETDEHALTSRRAKGVDVCKDVTCDPGFDGTPLHCVPNPDRPSEGMCVDACYGVECTPAFDGIPLRCALNPAFPAEAMCVSDPCARVDCSTGFDGTPLRCVPNPEWPLGGICVPADVPAAE